MKKGIDEYRKEGKQQFYIFFKSDYVDKILT